MTWVFLCPGLTTGCQPIKIENFRVFPFVEYCRIMAASQDRKEDFTMRETMEQLLERQKAERKALKKQLAEEQAKENKKYTARMVAAVRAYHKGMSDQQIMELYQAKLKDGSQG